ncbi:MAG: hypothetical protein ABSB78_08320 [Bacteroidota bacterium]
MKKIIILTLITFVLCLFVVASSTQAQQKYALLISAGETTLDDTFYHSEFWYDMFFLYRTLIDLGFSHDNIIVLYGNGTDFNSAHPFYNAAAVYPAVPHITDLAVNAANVDNIFNWLSTGDVAHGIPQLQSGDYLFYWWMGHGGGCACGDYYAYISTTGESVTDDQFKIYFERLPACLIKTDYVMTCRSGGLIDDLEGLHTMIHTATECCVDAHSAMYDVPHGELSYAAACALRQQTPTGAAVASDADGNGVITIAEANTYTHANTVLSVSQIGDYRNISPLIVPVNALPASGVINSGIYSRDYTEDNGVVPSDISHYVWYHGPDLWNRLIADGITVHLDPEFGQTNYVYGRIHNIGCTTLDSVSVAFSWCLQSAWANMASWNSIGTVMVSGLLSNESRVIYTPWNSVPAPGMYCLHTVLDVTGDMANADGRAYMDNNKVQVNVTVVDNVWGWTVVYPFLIENGLDKETGVDIIIDKLNKLALTSKIRIEIPPDVKFGKVEGAEVQQSQTATILNLTNKTKRAVVRQVPLKPGEKKMAFMVITTPKTNAKRERVSVKLSENLNEKEMGGIIFNAQGADQKLVLNKSMKRINNLFRMLKKEFKIKSADSIITLSGKNLEKEVDLRSISVSMKKIADLESGTLTEMSKLMAQKELSKYKSAIVETAKSAEKSDLSLIRESQDRLIYSTIPLFLKNKKISGF